MSGFFAAFGRIFRDNGLEDFLECSEKFEFLYGKLIEANSRVNIKMCIRDRGPTPCAEILHKGGGKMRIFRRNKKEKREKKIGAFPFSSWYVAD